MKLTRGLAQHTLVTNCAPRLEAPARALLETLAARDAQGPPLADGSTIDFGWSRLTLRADDDELVVHEPDFRADPTTQTLPFVDDTLQVILDQVQLCQRVGAEAQDVRWNQVLVLRPGALEQPRVYLERQPSPNPRFSGWYLGPVPPRGELRPAHETATPAGALEELTVAQVYARRPELLAALALPTGWLAVFADEIVEAILNPRNENVWELQPPFR